VSHRVVVLAMLAAGAARAAAPEGFEAGCNAAKVPGPAVPAGAVADSLPGDDAAGAIRIDSLPFVATGSTCGFHDDLAAPCTFLLGAPDVLYTFTPAEDRCVDIDLCGSSYDTAVHVYEAGSSVALACNDDACGLGSQLERLELLAGRRYLVVVDGWSTWCGDYRLEVRACTPPCPIACPPGARPEGEPVCTDGTYDTYNTGCNSWPPVFTELDCRDSVLTVCGSYGTYAYYDEEHRDTDWYQLRLDRPARLDLRLEGQAATQFALLDARLGCGEFSEPCGVLFGEACRPLRCMAEVPAGTYWIFVATQRYIGPACGSTYRLEVRGAACAPVAVLPVAWTTFKNLYRAP
jgi:hypothetical protein